MAKDRVEDEHDRDVVLAWMGANFQRAEKMPDLKTVLAKKETAPRRQTTAQKHAMLSMLSEHLGIPLRPRKGTPRG